MWVVPAQSQSLEGTAGNLPKTLVCPALCRRGTPGASSQSDSLFFASLLDVDIEPIARHGCECMTLLLLPRARYDPQSMSLQRQPGVAIFYKFACDILRIEHCKVLC